MIGQEYHHYIITRFNHKLHNWEYDKSGKPLLATDANWLEDRLTLFEPTVYHR